MVKKLILLKSSLVSIHKTIAMMKTVKRSNWLKDSLIIIHKLSNEISMLSSKMPCQQDVTGAIKAFYILHYAHDLDLKLAVKDGILSYKDSKNQLVTFQVSHVCFFSIQSSKTLLAFCSAP